MKREKEACIFCGRPAELLCDHLYGLKQDDSVTTHSAVDSDNIEMFTCDAPMCSRCSTHRGFVFFTGEDGGVESIDLCPVHTPTGELRIGKKVITSTKAEEFRRRDWKHRRPPSEPPEIIKFPGLIQ